MRDQRPINLNLTTIRFPLPAIVSILHRISGVFLFLALPFLLCILSHSLTSATSFSQEQTWLSQPLPRFFLWLVLSAVIYHVIAGIRHLVMDFGFAESLQAGRCTAKAVIVISAILIILAGVWL